MAKELAVLLCLTGIVLATDINKGSPVKHETPKQLSISYPTTTPTGEIKSHYNNQGFKSNREVNNDQESGKLSNTLVANDDQRSNIVRDVTGFAAEKTSEEAHQQDTGRSPSADYVYGLFVPYATQPQQQYVPAQIGYPQTLHNPDQFLNVQPPSFDFATSSLLPQPQLAPFYPLGTAPYHHNGQNVPAQTRIAVPQYPYSETAHQSITSNLPRTPLPHVIPYPVRSYPTYHQLQRVNGPGANYVSSSYGQTGHRPVQLISNTIRSPETGSAESRSAAQIPFLVAPFSDQRINPELYRPVFKYVSAPIQQFEPSFDSKDAIETHQTSSTPLPEYATSTLRSLPHLEPVQRLETSTYRPSTQYISHTPSPHVVSSPEVSYPAYYPLQSDVNDPEDHHVSNPVAQTGHRSVQIVSNNIKSPEIVSVKVPFAQYVLSVTPSSVQHIAPDGYRPEFQYVSAPVSKSKQSFDSKVALNEAHQSISDHLFQSGKVQTQNIPPSAAPKLSPYIYSAAEFSSQNLIAVTKRTPISDSRLIPVQEVNQNSESHNPRHSLRSKARKFSPASDVSSVHYKGNEFSYDW